MRLAKHIGAIAVVLAFEWTTRLMCYVMSWIKYSQSVVGSVIKAILSAYAAEENTLEKKRVLNHSVMELWKFSTGALGEVSTDN